MGSVSSRWVSDTGSKPRDGWRTGLWIAASIGFTLYVENFGSYNATYGALGGVIVFLVWLWIANVAVLLGAELNAELERGRHIEAGSPPDQEPFLEHRDTTKLGHGP